MPRFSLLTPTRDRPDWIGRCVDSVLAQTYTDWEQIVYDNGTDSVQHLIPDDPRIRYVKGPSDGPADAFQRALDLATGEIVHPISDDDRLTPDALETVDREIGDHEWLTALTTFENEDGHTLFQLGGQVNVPQLRAGYYLGGAIYWKRSLTDRIGGFDLSYDGAADYELYLRFAENAQAAFVPQVLYRYTDHPGTDSHVRSSNQMAQTSRICAEAQNR